MKSYEGDSHSGTAGGGVLHSMYVSDSVRCGGFKYSRLVKHLLEEVPYTGWRTCKYTFKKNRCKGAENGPVGSRTDGVARA